MSKRQRQSLKDAASSKKSSHHPRAQELLEEAADEPKKQIHAYIPESLHKRFKLKTVSEERNMSEVLEELIARYIEAT